MAIASPPDAPVTSASSVTLAGPAAAVGSRTGASPISRPSRLRPRKSVTADDCETLEQLPNIGPALAADLRLLGVQHPRDLVRADALQLFRSLCTLSGHRQDPCVLDTFMAVTDFMRGARARPWWSYTAQRKATHGTV